MHEEGDHTTKNQLSGSRLQGDGLEKRLEQWECILHDQHGWLLFSVWRWSASSPPFCPIAERRKPPPFEPTHVEKKCNFKIAKGGLGGFRHDQSQGLPSALSLSVLSHPSRAVSRIVLDCPRKSRTTPPTPPSQGGGGGKGSLARDVLPSRATKTRVSKSSLQLSQHQLFTGPGRVCLIEHPVEPLATRDAGTGLLHVPARTVPKRFRWAARVPEARTEAGDT